MSTPDNNVAIAALALTATLATGFFTLIARQNKTHENLAKSIDKMAKASKEVARATSRSAAEAEQRNGHLGELVSQGNELTGKILEQQKKAATVLADSAGNQHIGKQIVDKQIVKN
jgi:type II secretory pathway component PulJ